MTDVELARSCAGALSIDLCQQHSHHWPHYFDGGIGGEGEDVKYDPLNDDAQAMALLHWLRERGEIIICPTKFVFNPLRASRAIEGSKMRWEWVGLTTDAMHRRAICECVARLWGMLS